ncbi:MAG: iron-sulfur cluster assembly scaffold protein [Woeseiaceae bacterium]
MSNDPYSALVREYFAAPAHAGDLDQGAAVSLAEQGVRIRLYGAERDGQIKSLRFQAWGCPHVIAACELFCDRFEGKSIQSLGEFRASDIMQILPVPVEKTGRILVLEDAVRSLGQRLCGGSAPH